MKTNFQAFTDGCAPRWLGLLTGILATALTAQAKLSVVATSPDLASIAQEIGGNQITLTILAKPTEDPHFVDAKPSFVARLNHADVLIEGGAELEVGWLPALLDNARNPKIAVGGPGHIACAQGITLVEVPQALDRSRGDLHAMGNPHYLSDPLNARIVAQHIATVFASLDPAAAAQIQSNLASFNTRLEAKLAEWQKVLGPFQGQRLAAYHNTWPYFAHRFGLRIDLFLEPKPGVPPSPGHLSQVITTMKTEKIRAIIVEPYQSRKTAETIAAQASAKVLNFTQYPGGVKGTEGGYLDMVDYLVKSLAKALEGK